MEVVSNPVGRPSKYDDEMLARAEWYADNYAEKGDVVPTVVGLALHLGVATATVYNWSKDADKEEFLGIFTRIEQLQHQGLVNGGLSNAFNPAITKMMLTKHGYSDKVEQSHTSPDGSMTPTRIEIVAPSLKNDHAED